MVGNCCNSALLQVFDGFFHAANGGGIDDHTFPGIVLQPADQQFHLRARFALVHHIAQIVAMKAGDVEIGLAHLQLF